MNPGKKYRNKNGEEYLCVSWRDQTMVKDPSHFMQDQYFPLLLLKDGATVKGVQVLVSKAIAHEEYSEISE
jgi:hypothetical protein